MYPDLSKLVPEDGNFDWSSVYSHEKWKADEAIREKKRRSDIALGLCLLRDLWNQAALEPNATFPIRFTIDWVALKEGDLQIHTIAEVIELAVTKFCDYLSQQFGEALPQHSTQDGVVKKTNIVVNMRTARERVI